MNSYDEIIAVEGEKENQGEESFNSPSQKVSNIKKPHTPVRSKSPTLPVTKERNPSEKVRESWRTPENEKRKAWTKPSAWSASKMDRFGDPSSKLQSPPSTKYNVNLSSLDAKEFNSIFKSQSPRFKEQKIQSPPSTKYSIIDPNLSMKGDLTSTSFKTTTRREYEVDRKPTSPGPKYDPVITAFDTKKGMVSSFKSSVDRFKLPQQQVPPSTKYNVNESVFSSVKKEAPSSFGSTSPRFAKSTPLAPPSTKYDTSKYSDFNKPKLLNSPRSGTERFFNVSDRQSKIIPPVGLYNIPSNLDEIVSSRPYKK